MGKLRLTESQLGEVKEFKSGLGPSYGTRCNKDSQPLAGKLQNPPEPSRSGKMQQEGRKGMSGGRNLGKRGSLS